MFSLPPPRHISTLHFASNEPCAQDVRFLGIGGLAVDAKSTRMTRSGLVAQVCAGHMA